MGYIHVEKIYKPPCQIREEEDENEESKIGVSPDGIDLVVELILSDARGVAEEVVGEERLGGSDLLEEAIAAEEERGNLEEKTRLLEKVFQKVFSPSTLPSKVKTEGRRIGQFAPRCTLDSRLLAVTISSPHYTHTGK